MRLSIMLVAGLVAALTLAGVARPDTITLAQGVLEGVTGGDVAIYKDIPYAAPPVGLLRWKPPRAAPHWQGARDARSFGPACMQPATPGRAPVMTSEDCLTLNIWTPADHSGGGMRPVMVWIHGGSFIDGTGANPLYDGASFARAGVVLVTLNYRLGRFGFFAHPALTTESPKGPLANYGLMDQIAALRWVKVNIAAFGGDPANVTVFGESAGAMAVNDLMVSPLARGLFAKAISESAFGRASVPSLHAAESVGMKIAKAIGVKGKDAAALAALRALPADALVGDPANPGDALFLRPVLDGVVLTEPVAAAFAAGHQSKVPFLEGGNSWEASLMPAIRKYPEMVLSRTGADRAAITRLYGGSGDLAKVAFDLTTDELVIEPNRALARQMIKAKAPTWVYFFSYVPAAQRDSQPGARHGAETPYVFDTLPTVSIADGKPAIAAATADDRAMAKALHAYWISFAKTGDPASAGGAAWRRFDAKHEAVLEFGADGVILRPAFRAARLDAVAKLANPDAKP